MGLSATTWSADTRHPVYATRVLCEVANECGIATSDLLAGTGIGPNAPRRSRGGGGGVG